MSSTDKNERLGNLNMKRILLFQMKGIVKPFIVLSLFFVFSLANYTIFSNGSFRNGWFEKDSTCFSSQTGKYDDRYILYTQMATNSFLNIFTDKSVPSKEYKYLSFAVNWEDQYCNLRIGIEVGQSNLLDLVDYLPDVLEPKKWNRIVISTSSLIDTKIDTIRINKNDQRDTNIMFNDFMFTNEELQPGVFQYDQIDSGTPDNSKAEVSSSISLITCLVVFVFILI